MLLLKKKRKFKPLYKQFLNIRENVQNRKKILNFKKKKWQTFNFFYKKKLKFYNKFKCYDHTQLTVSKYPYKTDGYKKRFKSTLNCYKRFKLFYGHLSKFFIKKKIKQLNRKKKNKLNNFFVYLFFLELFEKRLDTILYRSKFAISIRDAKQIILHGKVTVNGNFIKSPSYIIKTNDTIKINSFYYNYICKKVVMLKTWPIPPKHLTINYKTMEIFVNKLQPSALTTLFSFNLILEKIIINIKFFSSSTVEQVAVNYLDVGSIPT